MTVLFAPTPRPVAEDELVTRMAALDGKAAEPFAPRTLAMLGEVSARLLAMRDAPPQLTALGFWLRPAALEDLRRRFQAGQPEGALAAPRGVALHLPPANVDTLFVYSWALAALAGNANMVRLPTRPGPVALMLMECIWAALAATGEDRRHLFCGYGIDGGVNARLCALADLRLVWGGDAKVRALGRLPLRPGGVSLDFPDRYSYAAVNAEAYQALTGEERDALARRFHNDVFVFDQMACSSPRVLYWIGDGTEADDFLRRLDTTAKGRPADAGHAIAKQILAHELAAEGAINSAAMYSPALTVLHADANLDLRGRAIGGGVLAVVPLASLDELTAHIRRSDQTLVHFGFDAATLSAFAARACLRGLSRLVPMGQALDFDAVWDGFDLLRSMTRQVTLRINPSRRP